MSLVAIGCVGGTDGSRTVEVGECAPPTGATAVATTAIVLPQVDCLSDVAGDLVVVDSVAQWDGLFACATPVPPGLDLDVQRAAVVDVRCAPIDHRFTAESAGEIVVGIYQRVSGACIDNAVVVPLPRSTKPVRLARCQESCEGDCPPVP
ncbi:MAG: hypothetical protein IPL61_29235 [Myxococcales bacterium]|nr:hypothetical protein [Myxococcales bacterium]